MATLLFEHAVTMKDASTCRKSMILQVSLTCQVRFNECVIDLSSRSLFVILNDEHN